MSWSDIPPELFRRALAGGGTRVWSAIALVSMSITLAKNVDAWPPSYRDFLWLVSALGATSGLVVLAVGAVFGRNRDSGGKH